VVESARVNRKRERIVILAAGEYRCGVVNRDAIATNTVERTRNTLISLD